MLRCSTMGVRDRRGQRAYSSAIGSLGLARPRTPLGKATLTGAAAHDPQRFRDRAEPESGPLGSPPAWLSAEAKASWREFKRDWPWLTQSDAKALAALCVLDAEIKSGAVTLGLFKEFRMQVAAFGGNPTAKTKVHAPRDEDATDPFADFDGRTQ